MSFGDKKECLLSRVKSLNEWLELYDSMISNFKFVIESFFKKSNDKSHKQIDIDYVQRQVKLTNAKIEEYEQEKAKIIEQITKDEQLLKDLK